jgi:lipoprotein-releasing system permease protein
MMFAQLERRLAWRYLGFSRRKGEKREGFITMIGGLAFLGIMLGVATLIIVMSVMNGFRAELIEKILGFNGDVGVYAFSGPLKNAGAIQEKIAKIPGVKSVSPLVEGQAMVMKGKAATGVIVHGSHHQDLQNRPILANGIESGAIEALAEKDTIMIGKAMARKLNLEIGETLRLIAPEMNATAFGSIPRYKDFKIVAVFQSGNHQYDAGIVFIPLETARGFFRLAPKTENETQGGEPISSLEVFLEKHQDIDKLTHALIDAVDGQARLMDWRQTNKAFFQAVMTERNVMFVILTLIIIIAAFNIISSMVILVKDKTRDIGILRTIGATQTMILKIFFITGSSIGVGGTIFGIFLGLLFCVNIEHIRRFLESLTGTSLFSPEIYYLSKLPVLIEPKEVITTAITALTITFIFTLIPAWRAARLNPVEALRHE